MMSRSFTVFTSADAATACAYLADFRHHGDWRDDVLVSEVDTGSPGADGTVYRQHVHQGPATAWRRVQAAVSPDGRDIAFQTLDDAPAVAAGTYRIEGDETGTRVHCTIEITFHGAGHALRPIVQRNVEGRLETYSRALAGRLDELTRSGESVA